jgi:hypothetical protein
MKYAHILCAIALAMSITSCRQKCDVSSLCTPTLSTSGFHSYQLDTVIIRTYKPGSNFSDLVDTAIIAVTNEDWWHIVNDTIHSTDYTFQYSGTPRDPGGVNLRMYISKSEPNLDFEVVIPSENTVYKISELTYAGPKSCELQCSGGSYSESATCPTREYIDHYIIDGQRVQGPTNVTIRK